MNLSNKGLAEVSDVYEIWLHSYLNGDIKTYDSYFDDEYRFIGSTNNEEFLNRTDTTKFFESTAHQLAGKTELRNSVRTITQMDGIVFITQLFDAYFLNDTDWVYYGRFRFTSALREKENKWKFIYQHFSMPDSKAQEGESIGYEKVAAENLQLKEAISRRTVELEHKNQELVIVIENLKATQSQLIQAEKMASLGELTAGIAHEIQNPLNFVNNFSEINAELIEELKSEKLKPKSDRDEKIEESLWNDIVSNLEKINHHGKRADAIVKGMLQHSRSNDGAKEATDINQLADEYLRLAYHGLRAKDKSFNAILQTNYDEGIGLVDVIPQDIGRVILNLITNAFYAISEKKKENQAGYEPTLLVTTKKAGDKIFVSIKDNGNGIPQSVLDKIFQPFFTTKPTGQGTGLGLSLSYDIVRAHGGELRVTTKQIDSLLPGPSQETGTEFSIILPAS